MELGYHDGCSDEKWCFSAAAHMVVWLSSRIWPGQLAPLAKWLLWLDLLWAEQPSEAGRLFLAVHEPSLSLAWPKIYIANVYSRTVVAEREEVVRRGEKVAFAAIGLCCPLFTCSCSRPRSTFCVEQASANVPHSWAESQQPWLQPSLGQSWLSACKGCVTVRGQSWAVPALRGWELTWDAVAFPGRCAVTASLL